MDRPLIGPSLRAGLGIDRPAVRWIAPARIAVGAGSVLAIALALGDVRNAIPLAFGLVFAGVGDPRGSFLLRTRGMLLTVGGMTVATAVGVVVAGQPILHVLVATLAGAIAGYVCIAGPRASIAAMVSLMMLAIYGGAPVSLDRGLHVIALVALGGLIAGALVLLPLALRRMGGVRADLAVAYRAVGFALREDPAWHRRGQPPATIEAAEERIALAGPQGATASWYRTLVDGLDAMRVAMLALQPERRPDADDALERLVRAVAAFALAAGAAVELEPRRRRVPPTLAALRHAIADARDALPGRVEPALRVLDAEAGRIAEQLARPYPVGRSADIQRLRDHALEHPIAALRRPDPDRIYRRHAMRLAIVFGLATAVAYGLSIEHAYWVPMTVALVTKPDYAATMPRLAARTAGVILGVVATVAGIVVFGGGPSALVIGTVIGGVLFLAFAGPGYAAATFGVTLFVEAILFADADRIVSTVPAQVVSVLIAVAIVGVVMRLWPTRTTAVLAAALAALARALGTYASPGSGGVGREDARRMVATTRARAAAMVEAAGREPGAHSIAADAASRILRDLDDAAVYAVAVAMGTRDRADAIEERALPALDELAGRLNAIHAGAACAPASPWSPASPFGVLVADAGTTLDAAAARAGRLEPVSAQA